MEPDLILCNIIVNGLGIDPSRVVVYNQNWNPPTDPGIYVIVITGQFTAVGNINRFDPDTNEDVQSVSGYTEFAVEISSKSRDALERKEEIYMALKSTYSVQLQEEENVKIFRAGDLLDLSFIEGGSALHRYRIPVRMNHVKTKRTAVTPIDKFRTPQEVVENV